MTVSRWTYLSNHPPFPRCQSEQKSLSGSLLEEYGEFALSIVGESIREAALKCGNCSDRAHDKAAEFGILLEDVDVIRSYVVKGDCVIFECRLIIETKVGDHVFYIGGIASIHGDASASQFFAWDGYARLDALGLDAFSDRGTGKTRFPDDSLWSEDGFAGQKMGSPETELTKGN